MGNFIAADKLVIKNTLELGQINVNSLNQFSCKNGEVGAFQIQQVGNNSDDTPYYVSQVFDCTTGIAILKGSTGTLPGMDLTGGLFSSGCFPDRDPLDPMCVFFKADY